MSTTKSWLKKENYQDYLIKMTQSKVVRYSYVYYGIGSMEDNSRAVYCRV